MSSVGGANDLPGLRGKPVRRNANDADKRRGDDIYERGGEGLTGGSNTSCFFSHVLSGIVPGEPKPATAHCPGGLTSEARTQIWNPTNLPSASKQSIPVGYIHTKASAKTMATIMHIGIPMYFDWFRPISRKLGDCFAGTIVGGRFFCCMGELQHSILPIWDGVLHAYNAPARPLGGYLPCSKSALLPNPIPVAEKDIPAHQIMSVGMVTYYTPLKRAVVTAAVQEQHVHQRKEE
ncbi:uncharacterized protein BO87DRAFT_411042 [Aspergillus neoniger CBS 115656]|uniref:Uncharacterized protein n=1 Tax=Aspergillus neoniger (strain CBS 115656) TaxID=1448310 RepID=A0A318Y907_ASPNB|nr:hypothetical protein BO87DRAFT_411042 [Aspergillus neoniger CBS 115656]PYH28763.1 hypothetical protein BO87DRAFT_411042 [Aspergillus neoniger CBS 115656]